MVYAYKSNSRIRADAQVAGEMCDQLAKTGGLTPKRLVDANRAEDAPLHGEFEWNDYVLLPNKNIGNLVMLKESGDFIRRML